ncbi:glycoside hydrolase family 66 protein [Paenibacillus sp. LHD-117]|uniref:glycoside hydrolase family 66 protein n=1 Tax=Paenibacillus sp. LHD-117 TaxID=3071412 RepID=UPI0027E07282|nr:glycoside hydrolase family 66 protein [Paenibacillus sp. LHD-117]MDQ6419777.1 glycoside hydrolase family 66 protein [Paenibacillus sp. LHD-117]
MKNWKRGLLSVVCSAALLTQVFFGPIGVYDAEAASIEGARAADAAVPESPIEALTVSKARYQPGEEAEFHIDFNESASWSGKLILAYYSANRPVGSVEREITVQEGAESDLTVNWQPPATDFRGYLVKAYIEEMPNAFKTAAVDVSSDWTHFPRYGYTSEFPDETSEESDAKLKQLSQEYYLNGYQFYDWMWRHDVSVISKLDENGEPLRDENGEFVTQEIAPGLSYDDLLGRPLYPATVKQQAEAAQKYGSAAMAYQMNYAAREQYEKFGVKKEWGLYNKNARFPNPDPLMYQNGFFFDWVPSALYLQDPGNEEWQAYITREFSRSVDDFGFDGIHLDQWGASDNDFLYDYYGNERYYSLDYDELINATKEALTVNDPGKNDVTFNMVGGNGGYSEVPSPSTMTDFDYSEIWTDKDNYRDLLKVIEDTKSKNGNKAMVIAAYMNYKQATGDVYPAEELENVARTVEFQSRIGKAHGWVGDFGKKDEDAIVWTVQAPEAGTYRLTLHYGHDNGGGNPVGKLSVNGQEADGELDFTGKTGWGNPVAELSLQADLKAGANTIKLQLATNDLWLNVDSLTVGGADFAQVYEAEYAELISCKVDQYGHVYYFETEGDYVAFEVDAETDGLYPLRFRYSAASAASRDVLINGETVADHLAFAPTGGFENFKNGTEIVVPLRAGANTVVLKHTGATDRGIKLDYAQVGTVRYEAEKTEFGWQPTREAKIEQHAGNGEIGYADRFMQKGDFLRFVAGAVAASGRYEITLAYRNPGAESKRSLYLNGRKAGEVALPATGEAWSTAQASVYISDAAELNVLTLKHELQDDVSGIAIDYIELDGVKFEAESAETGWETVSAKNGGVRMTLGKTDNHGRAGQSVAFDIQATREADELSFRYRSGNNPAFDIYWDGELIAEDAVFGATPGGWDGGMAEKSIKVPIRPGTHRVELVMATDGQYINLDSLIAADAEYEAEDAIFGPEGHGIAVSDGYATDFAEENDFLTFRLEVAADETAELTWRYRNGSSSGESAARVLYVNGAKQEAELSFGHSGGAWTELVTQGIELRQGANEIVLRLEGRDDEGIDLDYLSVGGKKLHAEKADALPPMVLYKDLLLHFGHSGDEIAFPIEIGQEGETSLIFTYSNDGAASTKTLYIDGEPALDESGKPVRLSFAPTANGDSFNEDAYYIVPYLSQGMHEITLRHESDDKGSITLKSMTLGFFDEPSVRLTDAALAAMGATHIELGTAESLQEGPNMLAHEYYPNRSKKMKGSLKEALKDYYKFFAAYENLLFDSRLNVDKAVSVTDFDGNDVAVSGEGAAESLLVLPRDNADNVGFEQYELVHLVNLLGNDENWRNAAASPEVQQNLVVRYPIGETEGRWPELKAYSASPDRDGGMFRELSFEWSGTDLLINVPSLEYWEMIIIDKGKAASGGEGAGYVPPADGQAKLNERIVSREELTATSESIAVKFEEGQDTLLLPVADLKLLGDRPLELVRNGLKLSFPASVLRQAAGMQSEGTRYVAVIASPISEEEREKLLGSLSQIPAHATAVPVSGMYSFRLGLLSDDGFTSMEDDFRDRVKLELRIDAGKEEPLTGLYVHDDALSRWSYAGGAAEKGVLRAELSHFSRYTALAWKQAYVDIPADHWAAAAIEALSAKHIVKGKGKGEFAPEASVTRAELAALLARAYGLQEREGDSIFRDVSSSAWYAGSVTAVYEAGWLKGRSDHAFAPNAPVTREEAAVAIDRIQGGASDTATEPSYADSGEIAPWAKDAVSRLSAAGILQGKSDRKFAPKQELTRAQAAHLISLLL